jgi:hypothetical protein
MRALVVSAFFLVGCVCDRTPVVQPQTVAASEIAARGMVVGVIEFRAPPQGDGAALHELNRRALALGADTVVGAQIEHLASEIHVTGVAVRSGSGGGETVIADVSAGDGPLPATVPMYDDSEGPKGAPPRPYDRTECPQCYVATRFSHPGFTGFPSGRTGRWGY